MFPTASKSPSLRSVDSDYSGRDVSPMGRRGVSPLGKRGVSPLGTRRLDRFGTLESLESAGSDLDSVRSETPSPTTRSRSSSHADSVGKKKKKGLGAMLKKMKSDLDQDLLRRESPDSDKKLRRTKSSEDGVDEGGAGRIRTSSLSNPSSSPTPLEPVPEIPPPPPSSPLSTEIPPTDSEAKKKKKSSILQNVKDKFGSRGSKHADSVLHDLQSPIQVRQILQGQDQILKDEEQIQQNQHQILEIQNQIQHDQDQILEHQNQIGQDANQIQQDPVQILQRQIQIRQGLIKILEEQNKNRQDPKENRSYPEINERMNNEFMTKMGSSPNLQAPNISSGKFEPEAKTDTSAGESKFRSSLTWISSPTSQSVTASKKHLRDLESEPEIVSTSEQLLRSETKTKDTPVLDDDSNPTDKVPDPAQTILQVLSPLKPSVSGVKQEQTKMESTSAPVGESPLINYGASAQRMRIKKPNLQKATLQRIFLQRRGSEGDADQGPNESNDALKVNLNGSVPKDLDSNFRNLGNSKPEGSDLPGSGDLGSKDAGDDDEVEIVREYLQPREVSTVTVSVHPNPDDQLSHKKRLSVISESEGDKEGGGFTYLNPEIEYSTIRRASDFTDSFRKLEPFKFEKEVPIEGKRERLYKVLVVGELGTGKTSIIKRYVHQFFSQHYRATIGVDFALKVLRWDPETVVRLQLWDIAGQERFGSMTRVYYKEAVGAFVVFDVARAATLEAVPKWKADLDSKVVLPDGRSIPAVLLANKCDQPKEGVAASRDKMNEFCQQQGFSAWFETSAKENINIDEAANFLVSKILEMDKWSQEPIASDPDKLGLRMGNGGKSSNSQCSC